VQVRVVKVKKSDKGDFYKRQMAWELRDLAEVDAKDASKVRERVIFLNFLSLPECNFAYNLVSLSLSSS
jgi:hypothetical protein